MLTLPFFLNCQESLSVFSASLSWSGHEVVFMPHRMPCSFSITSSIFCPVTSLLMPCRFPLHPPTKCTCCIIPFSSAVTSIALEHTPDGVNIMCFVFIPCFCAIYVQSYEKSSTKQRNSFLFLSRRSKFATFVAKLQNFFETAYVLGVQNVISGGFRTPKKWFSYNFIYKNLAGFHFFL